jgi:hypothetical protein
MNRVQYLREQAARADRLARGAFDNLTTERLRQAARDYLSEADRLAARFSTEPEAAALKSARICYPQA